MVVDFLPIGCTVTGIQTKIARTSVTTTVHFDTSKQMNNNEHIKQCETHVKNAENQLSLAREELEKAKKDDRWKHDKPNVCRWLVTKDGRRVIAVPYGYGPNEQTVLYIDWRGDLSWGGEAYLKTDGWRYAKPGEVEIRW